MKSVYRVCCLFAIAVAIAVCGWSQSSPEHNSAGTPKAADPAKKKTAPGKEMGKGGEDVGKGVAKGTGDLAKGSAGSVASLAHGNVSGAGASLGKGAVGFGKNTTVGTAKGVGKLSKGAGGEFRKLGHRSEKKDQTK